MSDAGFKNQKGEFIPEEVICNLELELVLDEDVLPARLRYKLTDAEVKGTKVDFSLVTEGALVKFDYLEKGDISIGRRIENVSQKEYQKFHFLDVGFWGDNLKKNDSSGEKRQRNITIVYRNLVILCSIWTGMVGILEFTRKEKDTKYFEDPDCYEKYKSVYSLLSHISSRYYVEVHKVAECRPPVKINSRDKYVVAKDNMYVFLPDLHIPIVTKAPEKKKSKYKYHHIRPRTDIEVEKTREIEYVDEKSWGRWDSAVQSADWYDNYKKGDIFRDAGDDLVKLMKLLDRYKDKDQVKFIQLGDMFDLWIGMRRAFKECDEHKVILEDSKITDRVGTEYDDRESYTEEYSAVEYVKYWVERTKKENSNLFKAFEDFTIDTTFLSGNHDNYLTWEAVYPPDPPGYKKTLLDLLNSSRLKNIHTDLMMIEHGHDMDASNRDGATGGHALTQGVFYWDALRNLDPNRRNVWIICAALKFLQCRGSNDPFFLFVMAHTHSPYLCEVKVRYKIKA